MNKKVTSKKAQPRKKSTAAKGIVVEGRVELESRTALPQDVSLSAYAVDRSGEVISSNVLSEDGKYRLATGTDGKTEFDLVIAKTDDTEQLANNALHTQHINAKRLQAIDNGAVLSNDIFIARELWRPWWPKQICISGHVRKTPFCPIPFVKVEIFDVDRGPCLWPWYRRFKNLIRKQRVVRIEDIQAQIPELDTRSLDEAFIDTTGAAESVNVANDMAMSMPEESIDVGTQATPTSLANIRELVAEPVTMTSKLAPWILFPHCFYRRQLLCTTTTDENGYFKCCFKWYPLQFRNGRFNFDFRPDIILRVTQTINGVSKVIYMDAYANTRWNSSGAHIDLFLDDPEIECGDNDSQDRPAGSVAFFTRIGNDEVYKINQSNGTYNAIDTSTNNMAYGHALRIFAQFGDTLSRLQNIPGAQKPYFYKLTVNGDPIVSPLKDTRVNKLTLISESHSLGPVSRGAETALFEVRNFRDYYWYNPDWIGHWLTATTSGESVNKLISDGLKTLKLEVFDNNGTLLDDTKVNYLNGTVAPTSPPTPLPSIYPCTMKVAIDNNPPSLGMVVTPSPTGCGVIPLSDVPPLNVAVTVTQVNNRVHNWNLSYIKGTDTTVKYFGTDGSDSDGSGLASATPANVDASAMVLGLTTTCAFALTLRAEPHIRNGYSRIYHRNIKQAIAVDA